MGVTVEQRFAVIDAIHYFYHLIDSGRASQTAALFVADARLTFGPGSPKPGTIEGAAIRDAMIARETQKSAFTRHAVSNIALEKRAEAISAGYLLTLYRSDDRTRSTVPAFVADVQEIWCQGTDGWRIAERTVLPAFMRS